jgi:hypothetical protein
VPYKKEELINTAAACAWLWQIVDRVNAVRGMMLIELHALHQIPIK